MAIKKIKLPDNTVVDINDPRVYFESVGGHRIPAAEGLYDVPNQISWALPGSDLITDYPDTCVLADDSKVVHKTGSETITGLKVFSTSNIELTGSANAILFEGNQNFIQHNQQTGFGWIKDDNGDSVQDALNAKQSKITISSSEPTSSQGSNGDIWIVI